MNFSNSRFSSRWMHLTVAAALASFSSATRLPAHCDGMDGPGVKAGQQALAEDNVNLALIWVQKDHEAELQRAFQKALAVRKLGPEAKELASLYFFEALVRLHRAGEGEPYNGLKPAGRDLGPAIPLGDKALRTGKIEPVSQLLSEKMKHGLHERFQEALAKRKYAPDDVEAGRAYVKAYVAYIHYVEDMNQAAIGATVRHPGENGETRAHPVHHSEKH